jgi:hypothetical protein
MFDVDAQNDPAGHGVSVVEPDEQYDPDEQAVQAPLPLADLNVPAWHNTHCWVAASKVAPALQERVVVVHVAYDPQGVQVELPTLGLKDPAAHAAHVLPLNENPASHCQTVVVQTEFDGHDWHAPSPGVDLYVEGPQATQLPLPSRVKPESQMHWLLDVDPVASVIWFVPHAVCDVTPAVQKLFNGHCWQDPLVPKKPAIHEHCEMVVDPAVLVLLFGHPEHTPLEP